MKLRTALDGFDKTMRDKGLQCVLVLALYFVLVRDDALAEDYKVHLRGKGASFPNPVYQDWMPSFRASRQTAIRLNLTYAAVGSGNGKIAILQGPGVDVDFAGTDSLLSYSEQQANPDLKMFPTMAGALVLAYNLPEIKGHTLRLTRELVVGIYNGTYTNWNDSSLREANPGLNLPNQTIIVLARADKSGSTAMFTEALSAFSEEWKKRPGNGQFSQGRNETTLKPYYWDDNVIGQYGQKTRGMSGLIMSITYTIGYLSVADVKETPSVVYAHLQNRAGNFVTAGPETVQSAMEYYSKKVNNLTTTIADSPEPDSYPIAGYTYFIVYMTKMPDCNTAIELVRYVEWFMEQSTAREMCTEKKMVPLSKDVIKKVTNDVLHKMTCGAQQQDVWELVTRQKQDEFWAEQTWRTPVAVSTSLVLLILLCIFIYFLYQRHKIRKMIDNDEWDIPIEDIIFYFDEKSLSGGKSKLVGFRSVKSFKSLDDIPEGMELLTNILQWPGKWNANQVGLRLLEVKSLNNIQRVTKRTMLWMRDSVIHTNVLRFFGLTELDTDRYVLSEYCGKGPMTDILQDEKYNFTSDFKFSLSNDIASGLYYLHAQGVVHGTLKSTCCLIDNRWNVKIADWEYCKLLTLQESKINPISLLRRNKREQSKHVAAFNEFWTAPEILRSDFECFPTTSSDIYSFSIILQEIFTREDPYSEHADIMSPDDVLKAILNNSLRPQYANDTSVGVRQIMEIGWADEPTQRPNMDQVLKMLRHANPTRKSMLDNMMDAMEEYTAHLEERIEERTSELLVAKHNMETLLGGLIPPHIASRIASGQSVKSEAYNSMAVLSVEILDFPDVSKLPNPQSAVAYLNEVNGEIETVIKKYDIFRATIEGDVYTLVSGFKDNGTTEDSAATQIAHLALDIVETVIKLPQPSFHTRPIMLRYGAHVGRVIGALVGASSPRYCVLGSTVKNAVTLRISSLASKVHISEEFHAVISKKGFHTEERTSAGSIASTSKDVVKTYWLTGRDCVHIDVSSDKSSDSGIDGVLMDRSMTTKLPEVKEKHVQTTCVTIFNNPEEIAPKSPTLTCEETSDHIVQEQKWHKIFAPPLDVGFDSHNDIELVDLSREKDKSRTWSEIVETDNPVDLTETQLTQEIRLVSPTSSQDSVSDSSAQSKKSRTKANKVSPMVFV